MWEYNHSTGFWTRLHAGGSTPADASAPTVPPPRVGHAAVVLQGDLWIFGGYDPDAGDMNDLWKFDRSEGTWSQAAPLGGGASATTWPATRSGASATASDPTSGTSFVLFGGNLKNDVWSYDVSTGAWSLLMNEGREHVGRGGGVREVLRGCGGDAGGGVVRGAPRRVSRSWGCAIA